LPEFVELKGGRFLTGAQKGKAQEEIIQLLKNGNVISWFVG
jgi:hypothetical protein